MNTAPAASWRYLGVARSANSRVDWKFSAEYGKSSGGIINAITKSGTTNSTELLTSSFATATWMRKTFLMPLGNCAVQANSFGASAGAPIQKDKMSSLRLRGLTSVLGYQPVYECPDGGRTGWQSLLST